MDYGIPHLRLIASAEFFYEREFGKSEVYKMGSCNKPKSVIRDFFVQKVRL